MKLLFFIVCSKAFGPRVISQRHSIRTRMNNHFQTEAYQCRDYAEFEMLQPIVAKQSSTLWCAVRCQDAQGQLHLPTEDMIIGRFPIDEIQGALEAGGAHIPAEEGSIPSLLPSLKRLSSLPRWRNYRQSNLILGDASCRWLRAGRASWRRLRRN